MTSTASEASVHTGPLASSTQGGQHGQCRSSQAHSLGGRDGDRWVKGERWAPPGGGVSPVAD